MRCSIYVFHSFTKYCSRKSLPFIAIFLWLKLFPIRPKVSLPRLVYRTRQGILSLSNNFNVPGCTSRVGSPPSWPPFPAWSRQQLGQPVQHIGTS
jgi:hypothetical protein